MKFKETKFVKTSTHFQTGSTIYSTSRFGKIFMAATGNQCKVGVLCHESIEDLQLHDLPGDVDVISLGACVYKYPFLAVGSIKSGSDNSKEANVSSGSLHIYSSWVPLDEEQLEATITTDGKSERDDITDNHMDVIGNHCSVFPLGLLVYHIYSTVVTKVDGVESCMFLVSCSDHRIRMFEPVEELKRFEEVPTQRYFPELAQVFSSVVTRMHIERNEDMRMTICGCEDGTVKIWMIEPGSPDDVFTIPFLPEISISSDADSKSITSEDVRDIDSDIISLDCEGEDDETATKLIFAANSERCIKLTHYFDGHVTSLSSYKEEDKVNIVITSAVSPAYVYTDIFVNKFDTGLTLKFSSMFDCVQACCVADLDSDGKDEIVIGTYASLVLVYKFEGSIGQWVIVHQKKLPRPVLSFDYFNKQLHVVTTRGIHILELSEDLSS